VDELRAVVPSHEWVAVSLAASTQAQPMCASSGPSRFGTLSHQIAGSVDKVLADVFGLIDGVTSQPPAVVQPGQAEWGPIEGATSVYTLAVQQAGPQQFNFFLGGEPRGAGDAWQGVFGGNTVVADPQQRSGELDINFAVMHALDPTVDPVSGGAAVRFSSDGGAREVMAHFGGIVGQNAPQPDDSDYAFSAMPDRTASFGFATHVDYDGDGKLDELVQIQSRWAADGSGTAHIVVTGGSLGQRTVNAVECWDPALGRVFYSDDQNVNDRAGDEACCPF
jgi:hypothetical protein